MLSVRHRALTKQIELQKKRMEALTQMEQTNTNRIDELEEEKKKLFSVVSHDLKGPFNRIFALTQLVQSASGNLLDDQKEYLAKIHLTTVDGLSMLRNLSDIKKLEGEDVDITIMPFDLAIVLGTLARNYTVTAEKKKIQVRLDMPSTLMVLSDKFFTNRILDNLLSNAVKFSSEGNTISIMAQDDGVRVNVDVRDEGPGISEDDQSLLFKKFQTLTAKPTGGETSSGIGLYVAKKLADRLNATLSCSSTPSQGAVFTLKLDKEKHD